jgi:hypothetical protein
MKRGGPLQRNRPYAIEPAPVQGKRTMTDSTLGPRAPKNEASTGWAVLLAILAGWPITLRLGLLLSILLAAVVAIVALVVIYLGPISATAVITGGAGGGYGVKRFFCRRRTSPHHQTTMQRQSPQETI